MSQYNKLNIIFVDDEPNIIQGLQRMLYTKRDEWNMYFASSGEEALNILKSNYIDVIIADMRMPGMNGATLLKAVRELYPQVVRIILSGSSENEMLLTASQTAHQFLAKPCSAETIKSTILGIKSLRETLKNEKLIKLISGIDSLPSLPKSYIQIEKEMNSSTASIKKIGDIISEDLTMTAKILQLVNSAFFGLPQKISNPVQAVNFIGIDVLKTLVLFAKIFPFSNIQHFNLSEFQNHSLRVGRLAKEIAGSDESGGKLQEEAFIAGMLHDIGKLILLQLPGYIENIAAKMKSENVSYITAETILYESTHAEAGAYLLGLWGLPPYLIEVLAYHHCPSRARLTNYSILAAVHIADYLDGNSDLDQEFIKSIGYDNKIELFKTNLRE